MLKLLNMLKIVRDQYGFSMIQGMVLAAVLAGSALVTTRLITDQKLTQKGSETRDQVEQLHRVIYAILQNQEHCKATFIQTGLSNFTGSSINSIYTANVDNTGTLDLTPALNRTREVIKKGESYMNNSVKVVDMNVTFPGSTDNLTPATLSIQYKRLDNKDSEGEIIVSRGFGGKDLKRNINIIIQKDPDPAASGAFLSCYAVSTDAEDLGGVGNNTLAREFCDSLAPYFVWDVTNNICQIADINCPAGSVLVDAFDSNGNPACRSIISDQWLDMNKLLYDNPLDPNPNCNGKPNVRLRMVDPSGNPQPSPCENCRIQIYCD